MTGPLSLQTLDTFGVEISGVDLSGELAPDIAKQIIDATLEHHVAIIRNQELDQASFDRFGRWFGERLEFFHGPDCEPGYPTLMRVSNAASTPQGRRDGAGFWHTDLSYEHQPAVFTMLFGVEAPVQGGETLFADTAAAYDALSAEAKAHIGQLSLVHKLVGGARDDGEAAIPIDPDDPSIEGGAWARKRALENPHHPLVLTHPITGRKSLYAVAGSGFAVAGLSSEEGAALMAKLKRHALQPRFRIAVKADAGDVLIWDDLATLHSATPIEYSDEDGKRRLLLRYTTKCLPAFYADKSHPFPHPMGVVAPAN